VYVDFLQKVAVPDISSLPVPLSDSDAKQRNIRQSSRYGFHSLFSRMHRFQKNPFFKPNPLGFWGFYSVLGFVGFSDFYLNEQLGSLLVDLTHQLSFYLDSAVV